MAYTILSLTVLVVFCTWCYIGIQRAKKENACQHDFMHAGTDSDVTFGKSSKYVCRRCGRVVST